MRRNAAPGLAALGLLLLSNRPAPADEPPPAPAAAPSPGEAAPATEETASARAEATARLKELEPAADAEPPAGAKELREALQERLRLLDDFDKAARARQEAEHPEVEPEREAGELKGELERLQVALEAAAGPKAPWPEPFGIPPGRATDGALAQMNRAVEAARDELKDRTAALEVAEVGPDRQGGKALEALRAEREKLRQAVAATARRGEERQAALDAASTPEARELARARRDNLDWEARAQGQRLREVEARLAREAERAASADLRHQVAVARRDLAHRTLARMRARYQEHLDRHRQDLQQAAEGEKIRAEGSRDPLERYRANRAAQLLDLQAQVLKDERALAETPPIVAEDQAALADRAEEEFARLKELVNGRRASALVALRLNNSYRRLAAEREGVARTELARAAAILAHYENALTDAELDLTDDDRLDRAARDALLKSLPASRHAGARALCDDLERKHRALLERRRQALERLTARAEDAHRQVARRLRTLDDQYAYVRTHIFWLRDAEPVGPALLHQARRESRRLTEAAVALGLEIAAPASWRATSVEFALAVTALVALPWPLRRLRHALDAPLRRARPAAGSPAS